MRLRATWCGARSPNPSTSCRRARFSRDATASGHARGASARGALPHTGRQYKDAQTYQFQVRRETSVKAVDHDL
eukprot:363363-Chlamydomonas_euryale.AAC.5